MSEVPPNEPATPNNAANAPGPEAAQPIGYQAMVYDRDADHLKILSILWYVWSGLAALGGCVPIIYVAGGLMFLMNPPPMHAGDPPAAVFGGIFMGVGGCLMILGW